MLMSVRVELTCRAWARDSSPSLLMLLLLTDRLMKEWADEWGKSAIAFHVCSRRDSRSQPAAWRGQRPAQVHCSIILDPVEGQIQDVQGGVPPQQLSQMVGTIATHTVTMETKSNTPSEILDHWTCFWV